MKTINIEDLQLGMFVVGVTNQNGKVKVKNQGWVKTDKSIQALLSSGVFEVKIDPEKTLLPKQSSSEPIATHNVTKKQSDPWHTSCSVEVEMNKAVKLYNQAKEIQSKAFADLKSGKIIDVAAFKKVASGFIDSVFRNQDALACIAKIREKDAYLLEHSINVSILTSIFAKHVGLDKSIIEEMATGALLHDIGKIKVSSKVLNKPGKLTDREFEHIKTHAKHSFDIVLEADLGKIATEIAGYHHERLDGSGYPYGLKAEKISQYVRMVSIVDVYDALTAERVYKPGMTPVKAFKILRNGSPNHFDEKLLNQFINCVGVYPVGTLVKLKSQKVGIVFKSNYKHPLKPVVKVFYHSKFMHYLEEKNVDLADNKVTDELEAAIKPEDFNLDLIKFFKHSVVS